MRQGMPGLVTRGHSFSLCKYLLSLNWVTGKFRKFGNFSLNSALQFSCSSGPAQFPMCYGDVSTSLRPVREECAVSVAWTLPGLVPLGDG